MHFRFRTAGESHGRALVALVEGVPAGLPLVAARDIDPELRRRQGGYGRGDRMKIEQDRAELLAGVRLGETIGAPIAILVWNRDWENWREAMSPEPPPPEATDETLRRVHLPRPGHADLVGLLKYARTDARDILERASARETTARVAAGAVAKRLLAELGITIGSHVVMLGGIEARPPAELPDDLNAAADRSPVRTLDPEAEARMIEAIDDARARGDTLGGVFEVVARGLPVGLGSHVAWDRRLDGRLAQALMSIQAMKGVAIGDAFDVAGRVGSQAHDEIFWSEERGYWRPTNRAGGLEGGMTNGEPLVVRGAMKPLPTLTKPLRSVDVATKEPAQALRERTDSCTVPAAAVVAEAMLAIVLAGAYLEKFGGDHVDDVKAAL
ncbi:MAG TPA: chorismate synthase, partial [Candidatus Binatia bacterium]|nr:chorismate synthase [Candidatus Binatia bacterium]